MYVYKYFTLMMHHHPAFHTLAVKAVLLTYKAPHASTPDSISELISRCSPSRSLSSTELWTSGYS